MPKKEMKTKLLKIRPSTHSRLQEYGNVGDTFDDAIVKLMDLFDKHKNEWKRIILDVQIISFKIL